MAVAYDGGVIMAADSRTSTGAYVANRVSDKLTYVHDRIYCCRSGSAADTQAIADYVRHFIATHRCVPTRLRACGNPRSGTGAGRELACAADPARACSCMARAALSLATPPP